MLIGLAGLPLAGKTTFFNLLTGANRETGLAGEKEVYTGSAGVPDERVDYLGELYRPRRIVYTQIQLKDIPGVRSGGGKAGRISRLLEEVRPADALLQVVRAFREETVAQIAGVPDPYAELRDFRAELFLADLAAVENRLARLKESRKPPKDAERQEAVLRKVLQALESESLLSTLAISQDEQELLGGQSFLSEKPLLIAVNLDEEQLLAGEYPGQEKLREYAALAGAPVLEICARLELEISRLSPGERAEFMAGYGLSEPGVARLARAAYKRLGLSSFFTVGDDEVRAWTVEQGTVARKAAGKVHSDMERGFIRAEVVGFGDLKHLGGAARAREKGLYRLEGKDYPVCDGDVITFRFNV